MKIDLLCEFGSLNGGEQSMLALIPLLQQRGVTFRLIAPLRSPLADAAAKLDVETTDFELKPGTTLDERRNNLAGTLWFLFPKFVHVNSLNMGRIAAPVLKVLQLPSIIHLRDIIRLNRTAIADLNACRRSLAVSEATRCFHVEQGLHGPSCHVMYNGVDLERFRPMPSTGYLHRELGLSSKKRLLAVIGQIGLRKGQDVLLDVLAPIFAERDNVHLLVVGQRWSSKPESVRFEQEMRSRIEREPFRHWHDERVHFLGVRNDIPELLNELTLLVHPARQEPLGRVLLEAAACGTAVVATDVGGTREIFPDSFFHPPFDTPDHSASARIVAPNSPDLFRRAIESLLDNDAARKRLGAAARQRAETAFSREKAAENLYRHYEIVLGGE